MSDPLSVCASVAGLVSISAKIASLAKKLYDSGKDAPNSISCIQTEMEQLHLIFVQVQMLLDGRAKKTPSRSSLSMLPLHHLMTILSGCVLTYSSLDKKLSEVAGLAPKSTQSPGSVGSLDARTLLVHRVKWILWTEAEAKVILADLERHKSSLHIMLTIIQGNSATESATEAAESLKMLHELVEKMYQKISQSNPEAATQLRELISEHCNGSFDVSISPTKDSKSIAKSSSPTSASIIDYDFNDNASIRTTASSFSINSVRSRILPFVEELKNSRPYKRLVWRGIDPSSSSVFSKDSKDTRGDTWSMLSDMSLGDLSISEISVLELPICFSDLYDPMPYQQSSSQKRGRRLLKFSSHGRLQAAIEKENLFTFRTYLALGADPNEVDTGGWPLLVYATDWVSASNYDCQFIQLLLDRGAMVDSTNSGGRTPLSYAAMWGHPKACEILLDSGAIIDSTDSNGCTPLSYAAGRGHPEACEILLDRGAMVDSTDSNGRTPLSYAAERGNPKACEILLDRGAMVDSTNSNGRTPLSYAAERGHPEACEILLDRGAMVDSTANGRTPLSYAAEKQTSDLCEILLDRGAMVDSTDSNGRTPLGYADECGRLEICILLRARGAEKLWGGYIP